MITDNDPLNASALRVAQQKTDKRIAALRKKYGIPENQVPPDAMLWLNDLTVRELESWSLRNRGKTTYARALAPKRRHDRLPRTLQELGYLQSRYVAYRDNKAVPAHVAALVQTDDYGMFILVDDFWGAYTDRSGTVHDATTEGYTVVIQQFLYCFDKVNAAIAQLDGVQPPQPVPRWQKNAADKDHRNNGSFPVSRAVNTTANAAQRGNFVSAPPDAFVNQDTIEAPLPSMVSDFRTAPKTPETWLALMSRHLPVPPRPAETDKVAMERYLTIWYEPTVWMINDTRDLEPSRAWAESERRIIGALCGPTWQAQKRATQGVQLTARDIVGPAKLSKPLTGATWRTLWNELEKQQWWPDHTTPYDGPPLTYEQGYQAVTPAPAVLEPPIIVEPPEIPTTRPAPMSRQEAVALCDTLVDAHPTLRPALTPKDSTRTAWYASVEIGPGVWHDFTCSRAVNAPETEAILDRALSFAAKPGARTEPPPIILEARQSALPQTEPLPALPADKAAMSLWIAEALLDQIERTGYSVQLRNLSDDRAYLSVETSPGAWTDIDSSAEWQQHLKSSTSPPGSIGAVLSVALQREAVQG